MKRDYTSRFIVAYSRDYNTAQEHVLVNMTRPEPRVIAVAAMNENRVIGRDGGMPWRIPSDLQFFKETTMGGVVVMGRKTFENVGLLPGREVKVMSRSLVLKGWPDVRTYQSITDIIKEADKNVYVAGGGEIYRQWLPYTHEIIVSRVDNETEGDVYFPRFKHSFRLARVDPDYKGSGVSHEYWEARSLPEYNSRYR